MLAEQLVPLRRQVWRFTRGEGFLFPGEGRRKTNRHLSPRTIERAVERSRVLSDITKQATPHSLRHSFATHLIESGTDIRFIQKLLGHTHLETTSLYTKVAITTSSNVSSPFDQLQNAAAGSSTPPAPASSKPSVGKIKIVVEDPPDVTGSRRIYLDICPPASVTGAAANATPVTLRGITVSEPRPGWINLQIPPIESWQPALKQLTAAQRERIQQVEFYEMLKTQVARRMPSGTS